MKSFIKPVSSSPPRRVSRRGPRFRLALEKLEDRMAPAVGMLDPAFGDGGLVVTDFGASETVADAVVQSDGKIVVAGTSQSGDLSSRAFFAARYNEDGSLDDGGPSDSTPGDEFGAGGRTLITFPAGHARAAKVAVHSDGRIFVVGTAGFAPSQFAVARLNSDGSLDDGGPGDDIEIQ